MRTYKRNMPTLRLKSDISTVYCKFELLSEEECQSYGIQEVYKIRWNIHGHIPYATTGYSFMGAISYLLKLIKEMLKDDETDYYEVFESDDDNSYDLVFLCEGKERSLELRCYLEDTSQDWLIIHFDESAIVSLGIYCQLFEGQLGKSMPPVQHMYDLGVFQGD